MRICRDREICKNINKRWWIPAVFTTDNYILTPDIRSDELIWVIRTKLNTKVTEVVMPHFHDAYTIIETMEKNIATTI